MPNFATDAAQGLVDTVSGMASPVKRGIDYMSSRDPWTAQGLQQIGSDIGGAVKGVDYHGLLQGALHHYHQMGQHLSALLTGQQPGPQIAQSQGPQAGMPMVPGAPDDAKAMGAKKPAKKATAKGNN